VNCFENQVIFTEKPVAAMFLAIAVSVACFLWKEFFETKNWSRIT